MSVTVPWKASGDTPVNGVASKVDEIRHSLSREAEHLAEIAASYGRDAGAHAAGIADDASKQAASLAAVATDKAQTAAAQAASSDHVAHASGWLNDLLKAIASLGTAIALSGRKTADDLSANAQATAKDMGKDLRKLRITTEPAKSGPDFTPGVTLLAGFGAGIALMWFLDPERGRARRNLLRDKLTSWTRTATQTASGTARDLGNRAQGAAYEARKQMQSGSTDESAAFDADSDTQTWKTAASDSSQPQTADGSTTDTWGEQPQTTSTTTY